MQLSEIIIERIRKEGPLSFHDFMEMCLYYPGCGYYTSEKDKTGKNGDYYTSPDISPVFGAVIARQLEEMWEITGKKEFTVVEYGAGSGKLCCDILSCLKNKPAFYECLTYYIIEKNPALSQKEKKYLPDKVKWIDSIRDIPPVTGCILSNELVDNFSVHRVVMADRLMEVFVTYKEGFAELLQPADRPLVNYLDELHVSLPKGFKTEINLEATEWVKEIATRLHKGYVITIDYGYPATELYCNRRNGGTLMCYYQHTTSDQLYDHIGEQDITSHVNFSALSHWGLKHRLEPCGFISQAAFLVSLGLEEYLSNSLLQTTDRYADFKRYSFLKYTLLADMGQKFQVLIQRKGVPKRNLKGVHKISDKKKILSCQPLKHPQIF